MIIILSIILGFIAYRFNKQIGKAYIPTLIVVSIISIVSLFIDIEPITQGLIGLSLFIVVMFAGAFDKRSTISKKLRSVRKEYSIYGFILLIPHFYKYIIQFITGEYPWEIYGIIAGVIMIPLFISSFTKVRRQMTNQTWKKIQSYSYIVYVLTFVHLIMVSSGGEAIVYSVILLSYMILKYRNYVSKQHNRVRYAMLLAIVSFSFYTVTNTLNVNAHSITTLDMTTLNIENFEDGTYYGEAPGFKNRIVKVDVVIEGGVIKDIVIINDGSTEPEHGVDFRKEVRDLSQYMIENQDGVIDSVSGATSSTAGLLEAVYNALEKSED